MTLSKLIAESSLEDNTTQDYFTSALRAAGQSRLDHRQHIINDVAKALGCDGAELHFLFDGSRSANTNQDLTMPLFRPHLLAAE